MEITDNSASFAEKVTAGNVMVDGTGVGDVGDVVLRDRRHLSQDGLIVVVATIDAYEQALISGPDITTRGFVYVRESEDLIEEIRELTTKVILKTLRDNPLDRMTIKNEVKESLGQYLFRKLGRKPMILPVIMNV